MGWATLCFVQPLFYKFQTVTTDGRANLSVSQSETSTLQLKLCSNGRSRKRPSSQLLAQKRSMFINKTFKVTLFLKTYKSCKGYIPKSTWVAWMPSNLTFVSSLPLIHILYFEDYRLWKFIKFQSFSNHATSAKFKERISMKILFQKPLLHSKPAFLIGCHENFSRDKEANFAAAHCTYFVVNTLIITWLFSTHFGTWSTFLELSCNRLLVPKNTKLFCSFQKSPEKILLHVCRVCPPPDQGCQMNEITSIFLKTETCFV